MSMETKESISWWAFITILQRKIFTGKSKWSFQKGKKLRLRRYVGENPELQASDQIFIEIKEHTEAMNYKRRVLLPANEAFALLEAWKMPRSAQAEDQAVIEEIATLASQYRLEPSAITSYQRQAYKVRKKDGGIRITFDQQVKYRTDHLSLDWKLDDQSLIEEDMEIMEIKIKDELPVRTQAALQICGIEQAHFSKYSQAVQKGFSGLLTPPLHLEFDEDTDAQTWKVSNQTSRINAFEFAA